MRPAIALQDIIGKTQGLLMIRIGPGQRQFHPDILTLVTVMDCIMQAGMRSVQPVHKAFSPPS